MINDLPARRAFLNAGGLGILVGTLPNPVPEQIIETFYSFPLKRRVTLDYNSSTIRHNAMGIYGDRTRFRGQFDVSLLFTMAL